MADRPISAPLPADLPENWANGQIVSPDGSSVGLSARHGYNYLMEQVNAAQEAANDLNAAFDGLASSMELSALSEAVSQQAQDIEDLQDAVSGGGVDLGGLRDDLDSLESTVSSHTGNSSIHVTSTDKQNWNSKAPGSLSATVSGLSDDLDSLESTVSGHTGNSTIHVTSSDKQNWNSKAPGSLTDTVVDLSSTLNGHTSNGNIHVTSAEKSKWDGYSTVHTLSYYKSGVTHYLTGLSGVSGTVSCVFKATATFNAGDTIRVDNTGYTIQLSNGEDPEDTLFGSGETVAVIVDKGNYRVNFKAGGGLSNSRLALANATAADVAEGKTFYAGDKVLKTGTLMPYKYATGTVRISKNESPDVGDTVVTISGIGFRPFIVVVSSYQAAQNYGYWPCMITCVNEINSNTRLVGELAFVGGLTNGYRDAIWHVGMTAQEGSATIKITGQGDPDEVGHFIYPMDCYYYAVGL